MTDAPQSRPPFRAVIFDMDGVLTDSEPAFHAAINVILGRHGKHIGLQDYTRYIGSATEDTWRGLIAQFALPLTLDEALTQYEPVLIEHLRRPRPAIPGATELLAQLRAHGVPLALCTASYRRWVDAILPASGIGGAFDALSTADVVEHTKPHPDPYRLAASLLGFAPEECVAIEDSANGLRSAMAAGCHVLQLRATATAAPPQPGVAAVLTSLAEFPLALVV